LVQIRDFSLCQNVKVCCHTVTTAALTEFFQQEVQLNRKDQKYFKRRSWQRKRPKVAN
jgi:hypothetical protein